MSFNYGLVQGSQLIAKGQKLQVTRSKGTDFEKGRPVSRGVEAYAIKGNIQPLTGAELLRLDEGQRTRDRANIWTQFSLAVKDIITWNGIRFEVEAVENWQSYYKARVAKIDVEPA